MLSKANKFKVKVYNKSGDIDVQVRPKPICTDESYIPMVGRAIEHVIMEHNGKPNTMSTRLSLRRRLKEVLEGYYQQGIIHPEGTKKKKDEEMQ